MADWVFPNPLADFFRKRAIERGETADRVIPKGADEDWLDAPRVDRYGRCPKSIFGPHRIGDDPDFCSACGALVTNR